MDDDVRFSVILPVCHGGPFLRDALVSLGRLAFPAERFEVLVAAGEEDKESGGIIESEGRQAGFRLERIVCSGENRSARLNLACARARGEVLVFSDDDCTFPMDWLGRIEEAFRKEPDAGIIGGTDEISRGAGEFDLALDWVINSVLGGGRCRRGGAGGMGKAYPKLWNLAIRREAALALALPGGGGGSQVFDESLVVHEDVDLARRVEGAGKRIVFASEVRVRHARDTTPASFFRRSFRMAQTARRLGVHRLPHTVLTACVVGAPALAVLSVFAPAAQPVFGVLVAAYVLALLAAAMTAAVMTERIAVLWWVPALLVGLHVARGVGYLFPWRGERGEEVGG